MLVYATDGHAARKAMQLVHRAAGVLKKGRCYRGTVTTVKDFGAFVRVNAVNEGLVPIEELDDKPIRHPSEVAREGEEMVVCVLGADDRGRLRLSRRAATEFSFYLGIPTLMGAGAYSVLKNRELLSVADLPMFGVGLVFAFFSALVCIRWLISYVSTHDFTVFAWYRIAFGVLVLFTAWAGLIDWSG